MKPRVGQYLVSTVDTTTVVVVKPPSDDVPITCGGAPMVDPSARADGPAAAPDPALMTGTLLAKRYVHEESGLELLCTKAGDGTLAVNGTPLTVATAKPLPASD